MHLLKPSIEGTYKPTLFSLLINKEDVLDIDNKIKDEYGDIFFHEYIHFLQDILTSFGLRNISSLLKKYSIINNEIIASEHPSFNIPYNTNNKGLIQEEELFRLLWGTNELDSNNRRFEVINMELHPYILNPELANYFLISVNILYRNDGEKDAFYLGAIHFLENMAYLLERKFSFQEESVPYPYTVIEKITKCVFEDGVFSDRNFILIMESALESHNPAKYYFDYYTFCQKNELSFCEDSILKFKKQYKFSWNNHHYDGLSFYYPNATLARDGFMAMFNHEKLKDLNLWAKLLIGNAIKLKRNGFSFTNLLVINNDSKPVTQTMLLLLKKLGTPIMTDQNHGIFMSSPDRKISEDSMIYLFGLEAILNTLNGNTICSILPYCSNGQNNEDITDNLCYKTPWLRTNKTPLCLFAQLWIMWGFVKKEVNVT